MKGPTSTIVALSLLLATPASSGDSIRLTLARGTSTNEAILSWTGGWQLFTVFASTSPGDVIAPANRLATTDSSTFLDAAAVAPGEVDYFQVRTGIELTEVPACPTPTTETLVHGRVNLENCQSYSAAAYINVGGVTGTSSWWTKPTFANPLTPIQADCSFAFNSVTGGSDDLATEIAVYLVPGACDDPAPTCPPPAGSFCPACAAGACALPGVPAAVAFTRLIRYCPHQPVLAFAERQWAIKQSDTPVGPGRCRFSARQADIHVDEAGLQLGIAQHEDSHWYCTEAVLPESLGYGTYCFQTTGLAIDPAMVAGMFPYDSCVPPDHREIDFEYARWGNAADACNAQYVVQPCGTCLGCGLDCQDHCRRFAVPDPNIDLTHYLVWELGRATFQTYAGRHCRGTPPTADLIQEWTTTAGVPQPGTEYFRFNFWLIDRTGDEVSDPPLDGQADAFAVTDFVWTPDAP